MELENNSDDFAGCVNADDIAKVTNEIKRGRE